MTKYPIRKYPILEYPIEDRKLIYDRDYQRLVHISISQLKRYLIQLPQLFRDAI